MKTLTNINIDGKPPQMFINIAKSLINKPMKFVDEVIQEIVVDCKDCHGNTSSDGAWLSNRNESDDWYIDLTY